MPRPARLLYSRLHPETHGCGAPELVASSEDGLPFLWMVLFGGRNFWEPDDAMEARGGAAARRNRWITPLEVAEARIVNAASALEACDSTRPYTASARVLARRVASIGRKGFVHVEAAWMGAGDLPAERLATLLALVENYVNFADVGQREALPALAQAIEAACPFVPRADGSDLQRLLACKAGRAHEGARRAAVLMCGMPAPEHEAMFFEGVDAAGAVFGEAEEAGRRDAARAERLARVAGAPALETPSTLLSRLRSMISRKGAA